MALAQKMLAAQFNKPGFNIVDHFTYVFAGDGCMMEGISHEACSMAGTFGLGKLIVFYDDNGISIDGKVDGWFRDDTAKRFEGYHWHVIPKVDGYNPDAIAAAIKSAQAEDSRPSLIICKTIIGYGAPTKQGTKSAHGEALGADEVARARQVLNWPYEPFVIPDELKAQWDHHKKGEAAEQAWKDLFARYRKQFPDLAREFERRTARELPGNWGEAATGVMEALGSQSKPQATRQSSQAVLDFLAPGLPEFFGGSADLTPSNNTQFKGAVTITPENFAGNYMHYGVREFGMTAALSGAAQRVRSVRRDIPGFLGLRAQCSPAGLPDGRALDIGLYPRLDRARRGRPDPSTGRAPHQPARHTAYDVMAAVRRGGDGCRLGFRDRAQGAVAARPDATGIAAAAAYSAAKVRCRARRLCPDPVRRHSAMRSDRDGFRSRHLCGGGQGRYRGRSARPPGVHALHGDLRRSG
jgi:hypothetical protein